MFNPCPSLNLEQEGKRPGLAITAAVERKSNKYLSTFPDIYSLLPPTVSMCRTLGSDTQALVKGMAVKCIDLQTFSQHTRCHLCW